METLLSMTGLSDGDLGPSLVVRCTVLLAAAWAAHAALRRRNPRWRVALWRGVVAGTAAMAVLALLPPVVRWPIASATDRAEAPRRSLKVEVAFERSSAEGPADDWTRPKPDPAVAPPRLARPTFETSSTRLGEGDGVASALPSSTTTASVAWALVAILLTYRHIRQALRLRRLIARADAVSAEVVAELDPDSARRAEALGVEVRRSAEVPAPCLAGARRPILLVPEGLWRDCDRAEMRAILAHELGHAEGRDLAWNEALRLTSIALWFHPLIWRARSAHASACDAVCDALAADLLGDVGAYGRALARIALRAHGATPAGALAMARASDVRRRIESLNHRVFRSPLNRGLAAAASLAFTALVILIGGLAFTRVVLATPPVEGPAVTKAGSAVAQEEKSPDTMLSTSGEVVDSAGEPVADATVVLRERPNYRTRGLSPRRLAELLRGEDLPDILAETRTDAAGRFRFEAVEAPGFPNVEGVGKTVFPWDVVALAPGRHGLAWEQLTRHRQRVPFILTLSEEGIITGSIAEPDGRPVEGAKVKVFGVDPLGRPDVNGLGEEGRLNLMWSAMPIGAVTDADGRFTIRGIPRDQVVTLVVTEAGHERLIVRAATTDVPQPDSIWRRYRDGKAEETRIPILTGPLTLIAKRADHVLTGRVVFEADGKPASRALLVRDARTVDVDAEGRFRIEGLTAGSLELHASVDGTDAGPADITIDIPEEPKATVHDLVLPRGLIVTGRVVEDPSGRGVAKVAVRFVSDIDPGARVAHNGFDAMTDDEGRFRLVVPAGRGHLRPMQWPAEFPQIRRFAGDPVDPRYDREVAGRAGDTVAIEDFRLPRTPAVAIHVVDPDGKAVADARVDVRDANRRHDEPPQRTDAEGRCQVVGLPPGTVTVIDVLAEDRPLGATLEAEPGRDGASTTLHEVRLAPTARLVGRVLDDDGRPIAGSSVTLYRNVRHRDLSGGSFGTPVATQFEIGADGTYAFDRLIPVAEYNTHARAEGHAEGSSRHVTPKPGQEERLGDYRLPASTETVSGVVFGHDGRPAAGIIVNYERPDGNQAIDPDSDARWFQETNSAGRFQLFGLPRGPIRLSAYRRPEGRRERHLNDIRYVDIPPGRAEVRIDLPDPNDRLRGIE